MKLRILAEAEAEYEEAAHRYDSQQFGLGDDFLNCLADALARIEVSPESFPTLETIADPTRAIRRCLLDPFPYLVVYQILSDEVLVLAVAHAKRRPNYWKRRLW